MKQVFYTIADNNNLVYAKKLQASLHYFHPEMEFRIFGEKEIAESGINKPDIFYMGAPFFAQKLFDEGYEAVFKIDADSVVTGTLNHIFEDTSYDVGVVYNWNRVDPARFGEIGLITIQPKEYYNNGFVAIRSKEFVKEWLALCKTKHFNRMPYREQGFLNILCHYGHFSVRCFDDSNRWHGLISKGEWNHCIVNDDVLVLPMGEDGYPEHDKTIKILHWAGGANEPKLNWKIYFNDECSAFLDKITHEK